MKLLGTRIPGCAISRDCGDNSCRRYFSDNVIVGVADVNISGTIDGERIDASEPGRLGWAVTGGALVLATSNRGNEAVAPDLPNPIKLGNVHVPNGVHSDVEWTIKGRVDRQHAIATERTLTGASKWPDRTLGADPDNPIAAQRGDEYIACGSDCNPLGGF
jgi:hypothetical protein